MITTKVILYYVLTITVIMPRRKQITEEKFIYKVKCALFKWNEPHRPGWMQYGRVLRNPFGYETWEAMVWVVSDDDVRRGSTASWNVGEEWISRRCNRKDNIRRRKSSQIQLPFEMRLHRAIRPWRLYQVKWVLRGIKQYRKENDYKSIRNFFSYPKSGRVQRQKHVVQQSTIISVTLTWQR